MTMIFLEYKYISQFLAVKLIIYKSNKNNAIEPTRYIRIELIFICLACLNLINYHFYLYSTTKLFPNFPIKSRSEV